MKKEEMVKGIQYEISRFNLAIKQADVLEQGKLYEFGSGYDFLGVVKGFSYGVISAGVIVELLATKTPWDRKSMTLSLFSDLVIKPVPYSDLPKYLGWETKNSFANRMKNINRYIKKGL